MEVPLASLPPAYPIAIPGGTRARTPYSLGIPTIPRPADLGARVTRKHWNCGLSKTLAVTARGLHRSGSDVDRDGGRGYRTLRTRTV